MADEDGGAPRLTIDNRLDRILYVPPIMIDLRGGKIGAKAGAGCNIAAGEVATYPLAENTLSFVLANVEKPMDVPSCGPEHDLFPER
jgi:hypothetical protein